MTPLNRFRKVHLKTTTLLANATTNIELHLINFSARSFKVGSLYDMREAPVNTEIFGVWRSYINSVCYLTSWKYILSETMTASLKIFGSIFNGCNIVPNEWSCQIKHVWFWHRCLTLLQFVSVNFFRLHRLELISKEQIF